MKKETKQITADVSAAAGQIIVRDYSATLPSVPSHSALERHENAMAFVRTAIETGRFKNQVHYGAVPGVKKPFLWQAGAQLTASAFGLAPKYSVDATEDTDGGFYSYVCTCELVYPPNGMVVGSGIGSANSKESKWAYRWIKKEDFKSDPQLRNVDPDSCRTKSTQYALLYRVPNFDIADLCNTLLKMAKKRAYVDAVLSTFGLGGYIGQDLDAMEGDVRSAAMVAAGYVDAEYSEGPSQAQATEQPASAGLDVGRTLADCRKAFDSRMKNLKVPDETRDRLVERLFAVAEITGWDDPAGPAQVGLAEHWIKANCSKPDQIEKAINER